METSSRCVNQRKMDGDCPYHHPHTLCSVLTIYCLTLPCIPVTVFFQKLCIVWSGQTLLEGFLCVCISPSLSICACVCTWVCMYRMGSGGYGVFVEALKRQYVISLCVSASETQETRRKTVSEKRWQPSKKKRKWVVNKYTHSIYTNELKTIYIYIYTYYYILY